MLMLGPELLYRAKGLFLPSERLPVQHLNDVVRCNGLFMGYLWIDYEYRGIKRVAKGWRVFLFSFWGSMPMPRLLGLRTRLACTIACKMGHSRTSSRLSYTVISLICVLGLGDVSGSRRLSFCLYLVIPVDFFFFSKYETV